MVLKGKLLLILLLNTLCKAEHELKNRLGLEVILDQSKNVVISPLMVRFPLCKLASVAQGTTRSHLLTILGLKFNEVQNCYTDLEKVVNELKHMDFLSLNKIILNYTDDVDPVFITNSTQYGIRVDKVGYNYPNFAISFVNRWVEKATYKRITDVLQPGDIGKNTSILIINAAYLKVTWEFPFDIRLTKETKFHHQSGRESLVSMMSKIEACLYLNDATSRAQYVTMKLASFGLTMTIIIPQTFKGLPELLRKLLNEPDYINGVRKRMKYENIKIIMPKFKIKSGLGLNEYLKKIGASSIFNSYYSGLKSILNKYSSLTTIYVSKVKQKNFIDVDEMGIFRQVPTEMYQGMYEQNAANVEVHFDHPFYFAVNIQTDLTDNHHIYNMFQGVYYGPGE